MTRSSQKIQPLYKIKGYSLAQLLIVIGIIVIITLVTFPVFTDYLNNLELKNSTQDVVSNLKLAQQLAVTEQIKYAIQFTPLSTTYQLIKKTEPETLIETYNLSSAVYFANSTGLTNNQVVYNAAGAVDESGEIFLTHLTSAIQTIINIKPSGYVSWQIYQNP